AGRQCLAQAGGVLVTDPAASIETQNGRAQLLKSSAMGSGIESAQPFLRGCRAEIGEFLAECGLLRQSHQQYLIELRVEKTGGKRAFNAAGLDPLAIGQLQNGIKRQQPILDLYVVGHHRDPENEIRKPGCDWLQQSPGLLTLKGAGVSFGPKIHQTLESPFNLTDIFKRLAIGEVARGSYLLECANGVVGN